jgi:threonine 3-dehydrogenase
MKALVKQTAGRGLTLTDVPVPTIRDNEVLVRVRSAGVCGTDVHIYEWDAWAASRCKPPFICGHEFAGDGCFAEFIAMPASNIWPLDPAISYDLGGIHDPMGNAFHTALTADIPGSVVLITGCGPIGAFAVGICKAAGAAHIVATDVNPKRLELARRMGANDAVLPDDARDAVMRASDGHGADVVLEMSGVPSAVHQAFALARPAGRVNMLGIPSKSIDVDFAREIIFKGLTIYGVVGRRMYDTWHQMTRFIRSGHFDPTPVITHRLPLEAVDEAMALIKSGEAGKIIFTL